MAPDVDDLGAELFDETSPGSVVLVGAGDIVRCDRIGHENTAALLDTIPGIIFTLGDNAYDSGSLEEYENCYGPSWGRHLERTRPAAGERDYGTPGATGYFSYFGERAGDPSEGYYSYDIGEWHIVVLNSNLKTSLGSAQERWLRADLAANPGRCILAYWHHPRFYSSASGSTRESLRPIWEALYEAGAALILNAHNRNYERFAPQAPDGTLDPVRGIRQFIVGTGGAGHTTLPNRAPNSEVSDDAAYGVLKLTLEPEGYSWEFVPVDGATFTDSGSGNCPSLEVSEDPTPPPPSDHVVLVGAGDISRCDNANGERTAVLLDKIEGIVFTAGDHVEPDAVPGSYDDCYGPSWGRHKERTWPAVGNNDYYQGSAAGYFDYWGDRAGERDKGYYSYDAGEWHIVVLNSNLKHSAATLQEQWLRADLAANTKRCIMAYWHHPYFFTAAQIPNIEGRRYPAELAGSLYPDGIPIVAEDELSDLIRRERVDEVVFAYSDVTHRYVMNRASIALAEGADFRLLGPRSTMLRADVPVVAITAVRTGAGKSQTTRRVAEYLTGRGLRVAIVRHPMPYGRLAEQRVQRFASAADLDAHECTIEEREEYEPHIERGNVVYAGIDYAAILERAQAEADILIWDGGNNDFAFFEPDLHITIADPHRPGHETSYHPGETNLRSADAVIINKVDTAAPENVAAVRALVERVNPRATIIEAASPVTVEGAELAAGKSVVIIEDGPTLTHGEMSFGAGTIAARQHGCAPVDPRPHAVGSLRGIFEQYPHLDALVPAMGYGGEQMRDLEATVNATPAEVALIGTPIDLGRLLQLNKPALRVRYELAEQGPITVADLLRTFLDGHGA